MKCSVLLITYNHSQYINTAIDSILMQEKNFVYELVVLDDCSTDDTFEIATKKLAGLAHVHCIQNELNLGITKNYQKGFELCKGEYVFVLEGDDYWLDAQKMVKQIDFLDKHPFHSICFHPFYIQEGRSKIFKQNFFNNTISHDSFSINDLLLNEGLIANFSVCCYRKKLLDKLPLELYNNTSYDWIINMFMGHWGLLGRINEVMSVYRHAENATWSNKPLKELYAKTIELIPVYDKLLDFEYSNLFQLKKEMLQNQIYNLENKASFRKFIPPVFILLAKSVIPPFFIKVK